MENLIAIIIVIVIMILVFFLVKLLKHSKKQRKLIKFLDNVVKDSVSVKSTRFLVSLGINNLTTYGYKLIPFYQNVFCLSTIMYFPELVIKISQYIKRLNKLKDSKEKRCLINVFKQSIFNGNIDGLAFIIYYSVKIKHRDNSEDGKIVEAFLLKNKNDISSDSINLIIDKINFYEKDEAVLGDVCQAKIRENLDKIIKNIKI